MEEVKNEGAPEAHLEKDDDSLVEEVAQFVIRSKRPSTSEIQRKFSIGYGHACRLLDALEERNIIKTLEDGRRVMVGCEQDDVYSSFGESLEKIKNDPLYEEVKKFILETKMISVAAIQTKFSISYGRATILLDALEQDEVIEQLQDGSRALKN